MQPRLDLSKRIAALRRGWEGSLSRSSCQGTESKLDPQPLGAPTHYEWLILAGRRAEEVDDRGLLLRKHSGPSVPTMADRSKIDVSRGDL
jgi:hypothetical protein